MPQQTITRHNPVAPFNRRDEVVVLWYVPRLFPATRVDRLARLPSAPLVMLMITWITMLPTFVLQHMFCDEAFPRTKAVRLPEQCWHQESADTKKGLTYFNGLLSFLIFEIFRILRSLKPCQTFHGSCISLFISHHYCACSP
jgi:hypothetical protein